MQPPLLETRHLCKKFGALEVLKDINLHIYAGDIYVLLGPNGAGKTTLLGLIVGLLHPTSGDVVFTGEPGEMAGFIGSPPLYAHLTACDNLSLSYLLRHHQPDIKNIHATLEKVGLLAARNRKAGEFSTGMRQRLGIARALLFQPRLVVLDEPTSGLDPEGIVEIREMIRDLNRDHDLTWLISSHMLAEVDQIATRICILMNGKQRIEATAESLRDSQNVFILETPEPERAKLALPTGVKALQVDGTQLIVRLENGLGPADLNQRLVEDGIPINGLSKMVNRLESVYFQICYGKSGGSW